MERLGLMPMITAELMVMLSATESLSSRPSWWNRASWRWRVGFHRRHEWLQRCVCRNASHSVDCCREHGLSRSCFRGAADYPPVISPITDKLSPTGVPKAIDFTLFDLDTDLSTFNNTTSFALTSSNQALVKDSGLTVIGSGADRTLRIVPEAGASGDVTISMVVTDSSGNSTTETFVLSLLDSRLTVSIDLDPTTDGIQSTGDFKKGDVVTANVVMTLTGAASLSSYGYSVRFDTDEVDFVSRTETPPTGMDEADNQNFSDENAGNGAPFGNFGWLRRFDAITLGNGPIAPGTFVVATLTFNVVNLGGGVNDVTSWPVVLKRALTTSLTMTATT